MPFDPGVAGEMTTSPGSCSIIIVNDNEMSIAENHGGMYATLAEMRASHGRSDRNLFTVFGLDYRYVEGGHHVAFLGKAACQRDGCAGVAEHEMVVFGFGWVGEAGDRAEQFGVEERFGAAGEHLVHVALVRDIEHDLVERGAMWSMATTCTP